MKKLEDAANNTKSWKDKVAHHEGLIRLIQPGTYLYLCSPSNSYYSFSYYITPFLPFFIPWFIVFSNSATWPERLHTVLFVGLCGFSGPKGPQKITNWGPAAFTDAELSLREKDWKERKNRTAETEWGVIVCITVKHSCMSNHYWMGKDWPSRPHSTQTNPWNTLSACIVL